MSVFSGLPAFAHDAVPGPHPDTADETTASEAIDTDSMKSFLLHFVAHQVAVRYPTASDFHLATHREGGDWRSGHVYPIVLDPEDGHVFSHGANRSVEDRRLNSPDDTEDSHIKALIDGAKANSPEPFCIDDDMGRPTCSVTYQAQLYSRAQVIVIVGYDIRDLEERPFTKLPGHDVPLPVSANNVTSRDDLEGFVKGAIDTYNIEFLLKRHCDFDELAAQIPPAFSALIPSQEEIQAISVQQIKELLAQVSRAFASGVDIDVLEICDPLKSTLYRPVMASEEGDWKSGSIYVFAMDDRQERVIFNGLERGREDLDLKVEDESGQDVGQLIIDAVGKAQPGEGVFVEYCWNDPEYEGDEVLDENGNPIPGRAPGKSYKVSYVIDATALFGLPLPEDTSGTIFGSGIYPKQWPDTGRFADEENRGDCILSGSAEMEEPTISGTPDDGACAVAGADNTLQSTVFNLFLIMSGLLLAVSFGRRVRI